MATITVLRNDKSNPTLVENVSLFEIQEGFVHYVTSEEERYINREVVKEVIKINK